MTDYSKAPPCPSCHGSGKNRHPQPDGVSDERWFNAVGFGHCPVCKGSKLQKNLIFDGKLIPMRVFFIEVRRPTGVAVLAACPRAGCEVWADATHFFEHRGRITAGDVLATCSGGHSIQMIIKPVQKGPHL